MKSHTVHLTMNVPARMDFVNITRDVGKVVAASGVQEGLCLVNAMHITASVFINDDEPGLHEDYKRWLEQLAPFDPSPSRYHHNRTGEDNGDAHHKRQIMGREVVVAVTDGRARLRALGADLLRGVRRPAAEAGAGQGDRRVGPRGREGGSEMRRGRLEAAFVAALVLPCAAGRGQAAPPAQEAAVLEAVFRQQIQEHLDATERARRTVVCLAIDPGGAPQSPGREFMARLAREPSVRRAAECDPRPSGAVEAMTLRPAIIVTAGPIEWIAGDEAWVAVSYFSSARQSAHRRYRVVREHDGWVSLGPILIDGPA